MTRADWIVIFFAVILLPSLYVSFWSTTSGAQVVRISHRNDTPVEKSLATDQQIEITGDLGISKLEIRNGKIHFIDSPCRGKVCIHSGWIQSSGQILVCLPNGIMVELFGGERKYDAINF